MLCGVYNCSGGSAREVTAVHRLRTATDGSEPIVWGPLAVATDPSIRCAVVDGIGCLLEGHLYRPADLARQLGQNDASDVELIALAYRHYGPSALPRLRGSFSTVLWHTAERHGVLASDLLATRPLFSWRGGGLLLFASELHDLLAVAPTTPGPDLDALTTWLGGGTWPDGGTLYDGVSRLGPGELIELEPASVQTRTYWRPGYAGTMKASRADLVEGLRDELQRSTAKRLSPRSSGVVLSGGLDSSIVAAMAARSKPPGATLRTYSTVFPGADFDESWKIKKLTSALELDSATFQIEPQGTLWLALQYAKRWQLPLNGAGVLVDLPVTEAARDGVEVALDGYTGDEVLGFSPYLVADRLSRGRLLAALTLTSRWPLGRPARRAEKLWILKNCGLKGAAPYGLGQFVRARRDGEATGPAWLLPPLRRRYLDLEDMWTWKTAGSGPRWWRYLADSLLRGPHRDLRLNYLRHRAAAAGVTNESPLYDADVIEYCLRLPPELAFDSRVDRPLAREAVQGIVPDEVRLHGEKAVFSSFCFDALTGADSRGIERLITSRDAELGAYLDMEWVRKQWYAGRPGPGYSSTHWGTAMWRFAAGEVWLRSQAEPGFIDRMLADPVVLAPSIRRVALSETSTFFPLAHAGQRT